MRCSSMTKQSSSTSGIHRWPSYRANEWTRFQCSDSPREFAMIMKARLALLFILVSLYSPTPSKGQDRNDDIVKVRTRVVFVDTLVQEKKTGAPVADLTRDNFEVLADGKPRTLSYFSRAGEAGKRPFALILAF